MIEPNIYTVKSRSTGEIIALVRAKSRAQARHHHSEKSFGVEFASQNDLIAAVTAGIVVVDAGQPDPGPAQPIPVLNDVIEDGHDGSEI